MNGKYIFGCALAALSLASCHDDVVFDQNQYNTYLKASFPVDNVDPQQTWATMGSAQAEIVVNLDYGVTYDVGIYLDNPIKSATATRVFERKVQSGTTVTATFSYLLAQPVVYVGVYDPQGRGMAEAVSIGKGTAQVHIGGAPTKGTRRAAENASTYPSFVKTADDYLNPVFKKVNDWDQLPTVRQISVAGMAEYTALTNDDLVVGVSTNNQTLSDLQYRADGTYYIAHGDGKHYRIPAGTELTSTFHINGTYNVYNDCVIYVEGKLHLNGNTLNGPTLVVAKGGEIIIDGNTHMSNAGRLVVLAGGKVTGRQGIYFNLNNGARGYNAGSIVFKGELNTNGSDYYNAADGIIQVDVLRNTSGGKFTNFGYIEARTNTIQADAYNCEVINGCHMRFTEDAGFGGMTLLDDSRLDVGGQLFVTGKQQWGQGRNNTLYNHSVIHAGSMYFQNARFDGPTGSGTFAIVKTERLLVSHANDLNTFNNIYWDIDKQAFYNYQNQQIDVTNIYTAAWHILNSGAWCDGPMTHFIDEKTVLANFTIPASSCTGDGYNDSGNSGGGKPDAVNLPMRFLFEDNYPEAGDYDFNDCVFSVTPTVDSDDPTKVTVTVAAEACGATKAIGGALRLVGITNDMLASKTCSRHFTDAALPYNNENLPDGDFTTSKDPNDQTSVVMLLFKDIHWVMNPRVLNNQSVERLFYNTQQEGYSLYSKVDVKTATYVFKFKREEDAQKMLDQSVYDAFIVEPYNGSFWEVHTVQNGRKGALVLHPEVHPQYQDYLNAYVNSEEGNLPWAVMVPGTVAYPYEWKQIHVAYPDFTEWAQDHTAKTTWYTNPVAEMVYR